MVNTYLQMDPSQLASREAIDDLLSLDGGAAERAAGSSEMAAVVVSSSDQGTEPGWPRVFHCDLNEDAELPLLAEPSLGSEQVGGLYAGEEVTAVGQQGDWLHVRLYEYEEEDEEGDKDDDEDVSEPAPRLGSLGSWVGASLRNCRCSTAVRGGGFSLIFNPLLSHPLSLSLLFVTFSRFFLFHLCLSLFLSVV